MQGEDYVHTILPTCRCALTACQPTCWSKGACIGWVHRAGWRAEEERHVLRHVLGHDARSTRRNKAASRGDA
jgi:hypothetical protein